MVSTEMQQVVDSLWIHLCFLKTVVPFYSMPYARRYRRSTVEIIDFKTWGDRLLCSLSTFQLDLVEQNKFFLWMSCADCARLPAICVFQTTAQTSVPLSPGSQHS